MYLYKNICNFVGPEK